MEKLKVLMTGAGAPGARGIIRCLRNNGERDIELVGVDMRDHVPFEDLYDEFYRIPAAADDNFIDAVLDICIKAHVQIVLPIVTRELQKFAHARKEFESHGIKIAVMSEENLAVVNNKGRLFDALKANGIDCPEYYLVNSVDEIKDACINLGYPKNPVCLKKTFGNGSRGVRILNENISLYDLFFNEKPTTMVTKLKYIVDILSEKSEIPEMMVMEYLPGEEYSIDVLADKGESIYVVGRRSPVVYNSIAQESLLSKDDKGYKMAVEIVKKLKLSGNVGLDLKFDAKGEPRMMEINPRLTATIVLNAVGGINFPYLSLKYYMGEAMPKLDVKYGTRMKKKTIEEFYDIDGKELEF